MLHSLKNLGLLVDGSSGSFSIALKYLILSTCHFFPHIWIMILALFKKRESANIVNQQPFTLKFPNTLKLLEIHKIALTHFLALHIINLGKTPHNYLGPP